MTNFLIVIIFLIGLSFSAFGSLNVDLRMDADSVSYNNTLKKNGSRDHYNMQFKTLRLEHNLKWNEDMSSRVRINLNRDPSSLVSPDGLSKQGDIIELANFRHLLNDSMTLTIGKFATDIAGWEDLTASPERYVDSRFLSNTDKTLRFLTGAMLSYHFDEQNFDLQFTNNPSDGNGNIQNRGVIGFVYKGVFMNKSLKPLFSMHNYSPQNGIDPKANFFYSTASIRFENDNFILDVDNHLARMKGRTTIGNTDSVNTLATGISFKGDKITPKIANTIIKLNDARIKMLL